MLDQRRGRWADVAQMLYKSFVFAGTDTQIQGSGFDSSGLRLALKTRLFRGLGCILNVQSLQQQKYGSFEA